MAVFPVAERYEAVMPSDSTVLRCQALFVGTAGNLVLKAHEGASAVTFAVEAGYHPLAAYHVMAATTASGIVALYF